MKNHTKLQYQLMDIPGDFPLKIEVPLWLDFIDFDNCEILNYIEKTIIKKNLHLLDFENKEIHYWNTYNIFDIELPAISSLKKAIVESYFNFLEIYNRSPKEKLYINGWISILNKKNWVMRHCHSTDINSYLSGFINLVESKNSFTFFHSPQFEYLTDVGNIVVENKKNQIVIFPQWLFHSVPPIENSIRIDLGFDLFTQEAIDYYKKNNIDKDYPIKNAIRLI